MVDWQCLTSSYSAAQTLGKVHPFFDHILVGILEGGTAARIVFIYDCRSAASSLVCHMIVSVLVTRLCRARVRNPGAPVEFFHVSRAPQCSRQSAHCGAEGERRRGKSIALGQAFYRVAQSMPPPVFLWIGALAVACLDTYPVGVCTPLRAAGRSARPCLTSFVRIRAGRCYNFGANFRWGANCYISWRHVSVSFTACVCDVPITVLIRCITMPCRYSLCSGFYEAMNFEELVAGMRSLCAPSSACR